MHGSRYTWIHRNLSGNELMTCRDEFGFDGLVLCEGGGLTTLVYEGFAKNQKAPCSDTMAPNPLLM